MENYNKYEADNQTGLNQEGANANIPVKRLTATSIVGDDVENNDGEKLGTIKNLMINLELGKIEYAILKFGGFMGVGEKLFAIPWQELQLDPLREKFILNRSKEYLKNAPGFNEEHWPDTNHHYYEETSEYWDTPADAPYPSGNTII